MVNANDSRPGGTLPDEPEKSPLEVTKERLRRQRLRRRITQQRAFEAGKEMPHHDVLFVPLRKVDGAPVLQSGEMFRFPVIRDDQQVNQGEPPPPSGARGEFVDPPEKLDMYDYAQRRVLSNGYPQDWGDLAKTDKRGPAFATIPVKPEPGATACGACYLINAENLSFRNAWTQEEWNSLGAPDLPAAPSADDPTLDVLLAGPQGMVFEIHLTLDEWRPGHSQAITRNGVKCGEVRCLDLRYETELWQQLRNGLVVGRVQLNRNEQVMALVNVTSISVEDEQPDEAAETASAQTQLKQEV